MKKIMFLLMLRLFELILITLLMKEYSKNIIYNELNNDKNKN